MAVYAARRWAGLSAILLAGWLNCAPVGALPAGSVDLAFNAGLGPGHSEFVQDVAVQSDGKIVIAGGFTSVTGVTRNHVARLNSDGSLDAGFNPALGPSDWTQVLVLQADGKVVVAGQFTALGIQNGPRVVRLNSDGSLDPTFLHPNTGTDITGIRALAVQPDGKLLVGGDFPSFNGHNRRHLVRLDANGAVDLSFDAQIDGVQVNKIAVESAGTILVSGMFRDATGNFVFNRVLRLNADGSFNHSFDIASLEVVGLTVQGDGKIIVASYDINNREYRIHRVNPDGAPDGAFSTVIVPGLRTSGFRGQPLALQADGKIVFSGEFAAIQGTARNDLARVDPNGVLDVSFDAGSGVEGDRPWVLTMALQSDGKLVIGGDFTSVNGIARNHVARLHGEAIVSRPDLVIRNTFGTAAAGDNVYNATGDSQSQAQLVVAGLQASYTITVQNDGSTADSFHIAGPAGSAGWAINYFDAPTGGNDITAQVTGGGWSTGTLEAGEAREISMVLTPAASLAGNLRLDVLLTAAGTNDPAGVDAVLASATTALPFRPDLLIRMAGESDTQLVGGNIYNVTGQNQRKTRAIPLAGTTSFVIAVQNDSNRADRFRLRGLAGQAGWSLRYFDAASGGSEITVAITGSGWLSRLLAAGESAQVRLEVVAGATVPVGAGANVRILAASVGDPNRQDVVLASTTIPRGNTLITDRHNNRIIEVNADGAIVWQFGNGSPGAGSNQVNFPLTAAPLGTGNVLIADNQNHRVIEVARDGTIAWQFDSSHITGGAPNRWGIPVDAERLENGNTLITALGIYDPYTPDANFHHLIEVTPGKAIVWEFTRPYSGSYPDPMFSVRLANGNTLITEALQHHVMEVTPLLKPVWRFGRRGVSGSTVDRLDYPHSAVRLANGNTLISDGYNSRVMEVSAAGRLVWQYGTTRRFGAGPNELSHPWKAYRLVNGNTLMVDSYRAIEVDARRNVVWQYGTGYVTGNGPNQLNMPTDARRIGRQ